MIPVVIALLLVLSLLPIELKTIRRGGATYRLRRGFCRASDAAALERLVHLRVVGLTVARQLGDKRLERKLHTCTLSERPRFSPHAGATVNKRAIELCVRDGKGVLQSREHVLYIFLHEVAHLASRSDGHTAEFYDNMSRILDAAATAGVRTRLVPGVVCGHHVTE